MMHVCCNRQGKRDDKKEIEQVRHLSRRKFVGGAAGASASFLLGLRAFAADTRFKVDVISDAQIAEAKKILAKYSLQVTDISSPLYKVNWPGAPVSQYGTKEDMHGADEVSFKDQDEVLERAISLAKQFKTNKVRCFDFWRIDEITPYRAAIDDKLQRTAEHAAAQNIILVLENEFACNTATGREAAATLAGVPSRHLSLNWDPGNAV